MEKFLRFSIIFLSSYLLLTLLFPADNAKPTLDNFTITLTDSSFSVGDLVSFSITNNTNESVFLGKGTPPEFVKIERYQNGEWIPLQIDSQTPERTVLLPKEKKEFSFSEHNIALFTTPADYRIRIIQNQKEFIEEFSVAKTGFFGTLWQTFFWKPLYNGMIGALEITNKSLGWAIILLTLIVKFILYIPTKRGMEAQKQMQKIQPEIEKIKAKYGNDTQKLAAATMELYKKHNIKPFASLLPILLQFPVLIGLYYVIIEGLHPHNHFFLYPFLQHFSFDNIQTQFLGMMPLLSNPLDSIMLYWIPPVVAIAQYFAMKLSFATLKKKANANKTPATGFMADFQTEMQKMNGIFLYVLPLLVLITTFIMPIAVALYWFISTLFGIVQQYFVNKAS